MNTTPTSDCRAILSERLIAAPRAAVFDAFRDPGRLAKWWGPAGFSNTFREFDLRPGGIWRFVMHAPDGSTYDMFHEFLEVAAPERIVFRHHQTGHDFTMTITLEDRGDRTRVAWRMVFDSAEEAERVRPFVTGANEQNLDRLTANVTSPVGSES